jgi:hypothetical protein
MSVLCASYKMAELTFIKINWQFLTTWVFINVLKSR